MEANLKLDRLPKAHDAERLTLGCIVAFPDCAPDVFRMLHARDFTEPAHRAIFEAMLAQRRRGLSIDPPLLAAELKSHPEFADGSAAGYLLELGQAVATVAHVSYYVGLVRDASLKRRLVGVGESVIDGATNGQSAGDVFKTLLADVDDLQRERSGAKPKYSAISAKELATTTYNLTYIIDRILVEGQPCIIGGPKKSLKTSIAVDLALSLTLGGFFLGMFPVQHPRRVLLCSAESGLATLQETAFRVCRAIGCELSSVDGLTIADALPKLLNASDLAEFARFIDDVAPDVAILDPLYRMHSGDGAENVFKMGNPLAELGDLCLSRGATPIVCHHLRTSRANQFAPAELDDLAYAGCAEYFRQWLLVSRREHYQPGSGAHRLWLTVGGSAGHNSLWAADVDEGTIDDIGGRRWGVGVSRADEARDNAEQRKADAKSAEAQRQLDDDRAAVCRALAKHPKGLTKTAIGERAGISNRRWPKVFAAMLDADELVEVEVQVSNHKRPKTGYKLNTDTA